MTTNSVSKSPRPSQRQHSNIIVRLWKQQRGEYFCISTKSATKKWKDTFFHKDELGDVSDFIEMNSDKDIYFCPHGFKEKHRQKPYAVPPKLLWADLDERDPRKIKIKPTIAIESSPGRYVGLWVVDRPVSEELNRRLNYFIGSDKSGWDLTQVLRVPGTFNYKYTSVPKVKILWRDGPNYEVDEIERRVPKETRSSSSSMGTATLIKKYERRLPHWCRRALTTDSPVEGKRSEMIYKIGQTLVEKKVPQDDALVMLKGSPWNKYRHRGDEDERLRAILDKALPPARGDESDLRVTCVADVEPEPIEWLWRGRLARGKLTIIAGNPGMGKSQIGIDIAARISANIRWPDGSRASDGSVLILSAEDGIKDTMRPRLEAVKADLDRVHVIEAVREDTTERSFSLQEDIDRLRGTVEQIGDVALILIDPITSYMGDIDGHRTNDVRSVLEPLARFAEDTGVAILAISHPPKGAQGKAINAVTGSLAYVAAARMVFIALEDPEDDDRRLLLSVKNNLAIQDDGLGYALQQITVSKGISSSRVAWDDDPVHFTADEALKASHTDSTSKVDEAEVFLREKLKRGPVDVETLLTAAVQGGLSEKTLRRAAKRLRIDKKKTGFKGGWSWGLPTEED